MVTGATLSTGTLSAGFTDTEKALDSIEQRLDFVVDQAELGDAMCLAVELGHRVHAVTTRLGLLATNNMVAAESGQRTIGQYVAARTNSRAVDIDRFTPTAKWLRDYRLFQAAFGAEMTQAHLDHLRKLDSDFGTHTNLVKDQQIFVDAAADCSFAGFEQACEAWLIFNDPDGKEPKDPIDKSRLHIGKGHGGRGVISGECDAVARQTISTAIEHEAEKLRRQDKIDGVERTDSQRNMAALKALITRGFAQPDGTFPVPLGKIVMSLKVAEWALATLNNDIDPDDHLPVHATDVDGRCELIDGTPIHPFLAVHALGLIDSTGAANPTILRRYLMEADSRILDIAINARIFPEWIRTGPLIQSRGQCETHGCDTPHHWLQMDHVHPVAHGGKNNSTTPNPNAAPTTKPKAPHQAEPPGETEHQHPDDEHHSHQATTTPTTASSRPRDRAIRSVRESVS